MVRVASIVLRYDRQALLLGFVDQEFSAVEGAVDTGFNSRLPASKVVWHHGAPGLEQSPQEVEEMGP